MRLKKSLEKYFHFISRAPFHLVAMETLPGRFGSVSWNGLCSRTYASGCKIQTVLKESKQCSGCKGKGRNFSCIDIIRQTFLLAEKEKGRKRRSFGQW